MNKIKLNNLELEVESYNKNTYFTGETIISTAACTVRTSNMTAVNTLAEAPVTLIQIRVNNELVYDLPNINAKIESINEYLATDHMNVTINLNFNAGDANENNS